MGSECRLQTLDPAKETYYPENEMSQETPKQLDASPSQSSSIFDMESQSYQTVEISTCWKKKATYPSTRMILGMGFMALVGLLSVSYTINSDGNLVPNAIFNRPAMSLGFFLTTITVTFFTAAIGMIVQEALPNLAKLLRIIAFVSLLLCVTVMLWALIPNNFKWVPWLFFSGALIAVLGVLVYNSFEHHRCNCWGANESPTLAVRGKN